MLLLPSFGGQAHQPGLSNPYHFFSAGPLVMLAEIAWANGVDLYAMGDRALDRLVTLCVRWAADPDVIAAAAGVPQIPVSPGDLAWAEIYHARTRRSDLLPALRSRALVYGYLGGDLTLAFGVALPEVPLRTPASRF